MHTPTPWRQAGISSERLQGIQRGIEAEFIHLEAEGYIAGGGIGMIHNKPHGVGTDNAAIIVAAVNSYEAMKVALIMARKKLELWPEGANPEYFPEVKAIDKALALAEGKE